jgi:Rab-GTPase-TBC domain
VLEVIQLDVHRSQSLMPQMLLNILKTFALYNPDVGYSQGMNYIVEFLISVFKSEEVAF